MFQCAFQMETMLADVALESSHARVCQLVGLQHRRSLEPRRAEIARERRVRGMDDHMGAEATGPQEALATGRAFVGPHINMHQLVIAQRLTAHQSLLANGTLERSSAKMRFRLMLLQRMFRL